MSDIEKSKDDKIVNVEGPEPGFSELSAGLRPCPNCGYCPTCGRPQNIPYYPTYPYQPGPWYGNPWIVTCGTTSNGTVTLGKSEPHVC